MGNIISLPLSNQLTNGSIADGGQVLYDLNAIASAINASCAKNGVNNDITQLTALTSIASNLTASGWTVTNFTIYNGVINGAAITAANSALTTPTLTGGTLNGVSLDAASTVVTQPTGTSNQTPASTQFVAQTAFNSALPAQLGNGGLFVTTDGTNAKWGPVPGASLYLNTNFGGL